MFVVSNSITNLHHILHPVSIGELPRRAWYVTCRIASSVDEALWDVQLCCPDGSLGGILSKLAPQF